VAAHTDLVLQVYGGAAQDFGAGRANWETYGWSLFRLAAPPTSTGTNSGETPITTDVKIQVWGCDRQFEGLLALKQACICKIHV
jgi:hypothetical protein